MKNSLIWQYNGMGFRESGLKEVLGEEFTYMVV